MMRKLSLLWHLPLPPATPRKFWLSWMMMRKIKTYSHNKLNANIRKHNLMTCHTQSNNINSNRRSKLQENLPYKHWWTHFPRGDIIRTWDEIQTRDKYLYSFDFINKSRFRLPHLLTRSTQPLQNRLNNKQKHIFCSHLQPYTTHRAIFQPHNILSSGAAKEWYHITDHFH